MKMRVQAILTLIVAMAVMGLASCDHYNCNSGATFGDTTCSGTGTGTGGNGSATAAFVFLANSENVAGGTVDGYTLNTILGTLSATPNYTPPSIPGNDAGMGMVVAQKQYLYTAYSTGSPGEIFGWTISAEGLLTAMTPVTGQFLNAATKLPSAPQRIITNPAGTLLFLADSIQDEIFVYQIGTGGTLTEVPGTPIPVGFAPGNLATDGQGNFLYATDGGNTHTGTQIAAFTIGGTGTSFGTLTPVTGSPFTGTGFDMWQVQGEPTGKFLIGTTGRSLSVNAVDDDNLYVFSIAQPGTPSAGAITLVTTSPTQHSPMSVAVQTNGNLVYSFGFNDGANGFNPAEGYILSSTGTLTAVGGSPFTDAGIGDVGQFDQSGQYIFVYGGVGNVNTVYQMTALSVVGGVPSDPLTTLAFGGLWVATDPQ